MTSTSMHLLSFNLSSPFVCAWAISTAEDNKTNKKPEMEMKNPELCSGMIPQIGELGNHRLCSKVSLAKGED